MATVTPAQRLAEIRRMLHVAASDYLEPPSGKTWRMDNVELRRIYRLSKPAPKRRKKR